MKKAIKKSVSMILVFLMVFSTFSVVPSEFVHSYIAKAAELVSSTVGASSSETYSTDDFTYTLIDEYTKVQILSYIGDKTDVVIPDRIDDKKVTSIANNAFKSKPITSVVFGQYLETIGEYAFSYCNSLTKVTIKDNADAAIAIGYGAFYNCPVLAEVDFGNSVTSIGNYAFQYCYELKSLVFPATLKTIGYHT
ncbi:MAG: leucine-rich repeat domain-containing protein, partial [Ruminococcus sp.]|nr:leucine-rich repeat domain-containing protein [Ruminococcus sp.]